MASVTAIKAKAKKGGMSPLAMARQAMNGSEPEGAAEAKGYMATLKKVRPGSKK